MTLLSFLKNVFMNIAAGKGRNITALNLINYYPAELPPAEF